jgi:hypothetical protein
VLIVVKRLFPLSIIENIWMKQFGLRKESRLLFLSHKTLTKEVLPCMVKHTFEEFVLTYINATVFVKATLYLGMSKSVVDIFALVINFLTLDWEPKHATFGLFEVKCITRINLVNQLQALFEEYKLINKNICYVKMRAQIYL